MDEDGLVLRFDRSGPQLVAHLIGDLDFSSAGRLVVDVMGARGQATEVVLDASALHFSDAAGVHALMVIARELADAGCEVVIRQPSDRLMLIIELTSLRDIVDLRSPVDPEPTPEVPSTAATSASDDQERTEH